ncbi:tyrosine-protein phosphatase Lar-like isoform X2 [Lytechinus variegatus]|uniref:tyrosine-protein phosphatase Lar-like isoform X2 n=1 Tax=Lytechinus variegatus TaxID=7654 RepID=UPI001BB24CFE|nr:tyrosine-protein phosphatase Lar-like isoform X2 [Lytechinus variegatus]
MEGGSVLRISPLRIKGGSGDHEHPVMCEATNEDGRATTQARLMVYEEEKVPAGYPVITRDPRRYLVVENNRPATIYCEAIGNPAPVITWFKDSVPLESDDRVYTMESGLQFSRAQLSDQGRYECAAKNTEGTRYSMESQVYVKERQVEPRFTITPSNQEVVPGGSVNLTCVAYGSPMPRVRWMKAGMDLDDMGDLPIGRNVLQLTDIYETANYTCVATSLLGTIDTSARVTVRTRPNVPSPPVVTGYTSSSLTVEWSTLAGDTITSHVLQYKRSRSSGSYTEVEIQSAQDTSFTIEDLLPYTEYSVRIVAVNSIGRSDSSDEVTAMTGEDVPGSPPIEVRARPLSGSTIIVQWSAPTTPNGVIKGYNVFYTTNPNSDPESWFHVSVDAGRSLTTISDLVTMQIYSVSVSAFTVKGEGPTSPPIQVKTQQGVPSQPEQFEGVAISAFQIRLTWMMRDTEPQIVRYELYYNVSTSDMHKTITPTTDYVLGDLRPNTLYHIRLAARSETGEGASSPVITVKTQQSVPGAPPQEVGGTVLSSTSIEVRWSPPPEEDQNGDITGYKIVYRKMSLISTNDPEMTVQVEADDRSYVLEDLSKYTLYDISVVACTAIGDGPPSDSLSIRTAEDAPEGPPRKVRVRVFNSTTIKVQWQAPDPDLQNGEIRGYRIDYQTVTEEGDPIGSPQVVFVNQPDLRVAVLSDLLPKTFYSVEIAAFTVRGDGIRSTTEIQQTPGEVPTTPVNFVVDRNQDDTYTASWSPPVETHGDLVTYRLSYGPENGRSLYLDLRPSESQSYTFDDLRLGTRYEFRLTASNEEGSSNEAIFYYTTREGTPSGTPMNVTAEPASSSSLRVSWDPPLEEERNGLIIKYTVRYYSSAMPHELTNRTTETWMLLTGLDANTAYSVEVRAHTAVGPGPYSTKDIATTPREAPAGPPLDLHCAAPHGTQLEVRWNHPSNIQRSGPGYNYRVYSTTSADNTEPSSWGRPVSAGEFTTLELRGLQEETTYYLAVKLDTPEGNSPFSQIITCLTGTSAPSEPRSFDAHIAPDNTISLVWAEPSDIPGKLKDYVIKYRTSDDFRREYPNYYDGGGEIEILATENRVSLDSQLFQPNMEYEFNITARTEAIRGPPATILVRTRIQALQHIPKPTIQNNTMNGQSIKIALPRITQNAALLDYLYIIVIPLSRNKNGEPVPLSISPNDIRTEDLVIPSRGRRSVRPRSRRAVAPEMQPYIAAKLTGEDMPETFVVGDGSQVNGYRNKPLKEGEFYTIFTRAVILSENGTKLETSSPFASPIKAKLPVSLPQETPKSDDLMIIIAAAVGGVVVLLLLVLLIIFVLRRRRDPRPPSTNKRKENTESNLADPVEMRRLNYQTPAMMSHPPIPVSQFQEHIERLKGNDSMLFSQEYESIEPGQQFTWDHSNLETNKPKNRYANVIAYDHSRVILSPMEGLPGSDYINANYCDGYRKQNAYIATQGPLLETMADFWRMVWEQRTNTIVMMTKLEERNRVKCDQYWPSRDQEKYGFVQVTLLDTTELATYTVRSFALVNLKNRSMEKREVKQFQFTAWPDHGVPEHATSVLAFISRVKSCNPPDAGPIVVHCSAGVGRTGAYIVIDSMLERIKHEKTVDIYGHVTCLRAQRNYMVQTEEQYIFIHEALYEAVASGTTEVHARNLYGHIQKLTALEPGETITGMENEFKRLASQKAQPSRFVSANIPANKFKNRLLNIQPYEGNRVCLQPIRGVEGSDYINASHIDGYRQRNAYIATQGPLAETTEDFWRMLWEQNSTIIVMLSKLREMGREKCHQYWPAERSARYQYFVVDPMSEYNMPQYILREFKVTDARDGQSRTIRQFQFTDWPEQGVPKSGEGFIDFIGQVHKTKEQFGQEGPITVHCSAGVGRTGVFITLSVVLERMRYEGIVDMFQTVKMLRTQRPAMVQTEDQYQFCYHAALEYLGSFDHYT